MKSTATMFLAFVAIAVASRWAPADRPVSAMMAVQAPAPGGRAGGAGARPAVDPAVLERGQGLYSVNCASCHGSEARGGETGPNLLRSAVILDDQAGELLLPVVRMGRADKGMPP